MWAPLRIEKERDFLCSLISSGKEVTGWDHSLDQGNIQTPWRCASGQVAVNQCMEVLQSDYVGKTLGHWPRPKVVGSKHGGA